MKTLMIVFTMTLLMLSGITKAGVLSSSVDRLTIGEDETLTLNIVYDDASVSGHPNLTGLENIFNIVNSGSSSKTSIINGSVTSSKIWRYTLSPKKTGKFFIPSFSLDNSYSEPIEITVLENTAAHDPQSANRGDLFVQATVNKRDAYVQEMITLTLRIYTSVQIAQPKLEELNIPGFMVEKTGESQFETREGDRNYYVLEYRYALFAQQSGELNIPKQRYQIAQIISNGPRSLFDITELGTQTQARFLSTMDIPIHIKAAPANNPTDYWLAGDDVTLTDNWTDVQHVDTGTPLTRTIEIKVLGNLAANIPPLPEQTIHGLKTYREPAVLTNTRAGDNLLATRTESAAIVAVAAGQYTLPEIRLHWWSNKEKQFKVSTLPQRSFIAEGSGSIAADPSPEPENNGSPATDSGNTPIGISVTKEPLYLNVYLWMGTAAIVLLAWLLTLALLLKKNRSPLSRASSTKSESIKITVKDLKKACQANDTKQVRAALLLWAQKKWPADHLLTLQDIKQKINNQDFDALANDLDAALYRDTTAWNGKPMLDFLQSSPLFLSSKNSPSRPENDSLPELYR